MNKKFENMTEVELSAVLKSCANAVKGSCSFHCVEKPKFVLLLFNDPHAAQYISDCERADTILALREAADRLEQRQDVER